MQPLAIAILEYGSVAAGLQAADAMLKRAPLSLFKAGTVHPGRFVTLIGGTVASVEEAHAHGTTIHPAFLIDEVFLPDVHPWVFEAVRGVRRAPDGEALGIVETRGVASVVRASDAAVKGASVRVVEIRMADDLGGNAFLLVDGLVADVQTAVRIGTERAGPEALVGVTIARLDETLRRALSRGTCFAGCEELNPEGDERAPR